MGRERGWRRGEVKGSGGDGRVERMWREKGKDRERGGVEKKGDREKKGIGRRGEIG